MEKRRLYFPHNSNLPVVSFDRKWRHKVFKNAYLWKYLSYRAQTWYTFLKVCASILCSCRGRHFRYKVWWNGIFHMVTILLKLLYQSALPFCYTGNWTHVINGDSDLPGSETDRNCEDAPVSSETEASQDFSANFMDSPPSNLLWWPALTMIYPE